jgi:DNA-binding NtrC family response regulator
MIKLHRTGSINLPGEDGVSLPQRVRATQPGIGIIMLTVRSKTVDRTTGYQSGADIYPTKPTSQEELGAALQAASLRLKPPGAVPEQRVLAFTLDMQRFMLAGPQAQVSLNALEATGRQCSDQRRMEAAGKRADFEVVGQVRDQLLQGPVGGADFPAAQKAGASQC